MGLAGRADSRFRTYSLGMKQRLGLAYSLLGDPELLFLDEPTNGMDPAGMAEVRDLIRSLGTGGRTVLLSSHLLHEVEQVCVSVAILSKGRLIVQGKVEDLLHLRGGERVRMRTTDNAKAIKVISALGWLTCPPSWSNWNVRPWAAQRGKDGQEETYAGAGDQQAERG